MSIPIFKIHVIDEAFVVNVTLNERSHISPMMPSLGILVSAETSVVSTSISYIESIVYPVVIVKSASVKHKSYSGVT